MKVERIEVLDKVIITLNVDELFDLSSLLHESEITLRKCKNVPERRKLLSIMKKFRTKVRKAIFPNL